MKKKYIDAEKLKRKIKSLKDIYNHPNRVIHGIADAFRQDGRVAMCDDIMGEIESLQQEQPEVDVEKEIFEAEKRYGDIDEMGGYTIRIFDDEFRSLLHYFYELGLNARKSIWHNVSEETPTDYGSEVIVACRNKNKEDGIWLYDLIQCWEGKWEPRVNWETPVKWAYVKDLDNARKEEKT